MSPKPMTHTENLIAAVVNRPRPLIGALCLAHFIRHRRREIGLTVPEAAALAGMELSEWYALEAGWIPAADDFRLRAIAATLEVCWTRVDFAAFWARLFAENRAA
jgi:hypothetical protein